MELNTNFEERVIVDSEKLEWQKSPMVGVERRMLDRIGDEIARATTIVRYAPGSNFSPHVHTGGEEFIVLEGVFQDEHGDYPAGSYIRNPPTSSHTPSSELGCVIFVKLWQFDMDDRTAVKIDMNKMPSVPSAERPGVSIMPLFQDERETVQLETWDAGAQIDMDFPEGAEFLVLDGEFEDRNDNLARHSWLRLPLKSQIRATAGAKGVKVWVKTRHLRHVSAPLVD